MEISKVAYFWKAYSMRNLKINVYICTDAYMAIKFQFQNDSQQNKNLSIHLPLTNGNFLQNTYPMFSYP